MRKSIVLCIIILSLASLASADTLTLVSGNVPVGQRDPNITVWGAPVVINGTSYSSASIAQQQALVINKNHDWTTLTGSQWVGVADGEAHSASGGYIYRIRFSLPQNFTLADIFVSMSCDNYGQVYLNGNLLGTAATEPPSIFTRISQFNCFNQSYFLSGTNTLDFKVVNLPLPAGMTNPTGLIYNANINYTPVVPEPSSLIALFAGLPMLAGMALRKKK